MKNNNAIHVYTTILAFFVCLIIHTNINAQGTDCTSATSLTINGACSSGTINDATATAPALSSCTAGTVRREGWYKFTVSAGPQNIAITVDAADRDLFVQVISQTGACTGLAQIGCANATTGSSAQVETVNLSALANGTYYVKLVNVGTNGDMIINSICITAPASNDICSSAISASCASTYSGTTVGASTTGDPTANCGTTPSAAGVWYVYTGNGATVTASLCSGTSFDSKINVYSGTSCASLTCVGGNDDGCSTQSTITFNTVAGTNYYILVNGYSGATGTFNLAMTCCTPSAPACATLNSPTNGATGTSPCSPQLSWTAGASSGCNAATSYDVHFGTTNPPPFLSNTTSTTFNIPTGLNNSSIYYWKVVPRNSSGAATCTTVFSFTTGTTANANYCMVGTASDYPAGGSNCAQMTSETNNQLGCIWNKGQISFASAFDYTVSMYFGNNVNGADGCAFVFQNSPQGLSACGNNGGQLGAGGISNSVIIEFDTYDNDNPAHVYDRLEDHVAIEVDGNLQGPGAPLAGPAIADPTDNVIDDGNTYTLRVTWNPATQTMNVYVNGNLRLTTTYDFITNVFGGNSNVFWGFTGATGGLNNQQYFCPQNIPLPVTLKNFTAVCNNGKVDINWITTSEIDNSYFNIERTSNGSDFENIATISSSNNKNNISEYSFTDEKPLSGNSYYRLRQTDNNGKTSTFDVVSVNCNSGYTSADFDIYSLINTDKKLEFTLITPEGGEYTAYVQDMLGNIIATSTLKTNSGNNKTSIELPEIKNGIYLLRVFNENKAVNKKVYIYN